MTAATQHQLDGRGAGVFRRLRLQLAAKGRTLLVAGRLHETAGYRVEHRGDTRHFDSLADVRNHLAQIGGRE